MLAKLKLGALATTPDVYIQEKFLSAKEEPLPGELRGLFFAFQREERWLIAFRAEDDALIVRQNRLNNSWMSPDSTRWVAMSDFPLFLVKANLPFNGKERRLAAAFIRKIQRIRGTAKSDWEGMMSEWSQMCEAYDLLAAKSEKVLARLQKEIHVREKHALAAEAALAQTNYKPLTEIRVPPFQFVARPSQIALFADWTDKRREVWAANAVKTILAAKGGGENANS